MSELSGRTGYRGYVASRAVRGTCFPQQVQNLVVRDYATRRGMRYLLSATEYAMPSCYLMLNAVLDELPTLQGVIMFSIFMLPRRKPARLNIFERVLAAGAELHAALENVKLQDSSDVPALEDLIDIAFTLPRLPMSGRYEKEESAARERVKDPFWAELCNAL